MGKYDDIINIEYVKSFTRKHMTMSERAAQFGAFKAVTGHEDAVYETARLTDERIELDEYAKQEINSRLNFIALHINEKPEVSITYFVPDDKKTGGEYITKTGCVTKIMRYEREIVMEGGCEIPIDDIIAIDGSCINL